MESKINEEVKQEEFKYPCLKESKTSYGHTIVLFTYSMTGTCVYSTNVGNDLGSYSDAWAESIFTIFNGEITLKN